MHAPHTARPPPPPLVPAAVEATHRLYLLLRALRRMGTLPDEVVEYSGLLQPEERAASLDAFASGAAKVRREGDERRGGVGDACLPALLRALRDSEACLRPLKPSRCWCAPTR